jgi:hypothetical protein
MFSPLGAPIGGRPINLFTNLIYPPLACEDYINFRQAFLPIVTSNPHVSHETVTTIVVIRRYPLTPTSKRRGSRPKPAASHWTMVIDLSLLHLELLL